MDRVSITHEHPYFRFLVLSIAEGPHVTPSRGKEKAASSPLAASPLAADPLAPSLDQLRLQARLIPKAREDLPVAGPGPPRVLDSKVLWISVYERSMCRVHKRDDLRR